MKIFIILSYSFSLLFSLETLKVGYLLEANILSQKHSDIIVNVISKQVNKINKNIQYKLIKYTNKNKILQDYTNKKIKAIAISTHNYFDHKNELNNISQKAWAINYSNKKYEEFYLIKNRASKYTLKDIYKSNFYLKEGSFPSRIWLNHMLMEEFKENYRNIIKDESLIRKDYKLVTRVFFNKNAMAVINKDVYNYIKEINPQIINKIDIMKKSGAFFSSILLIAHKSIKKDNFDNFENVFKKFTKIFKGTAYNSLTNIQHLGINDVYLSKYENFYTEYKKLKKKILSNKENSLYYSSNSKEAK